MADLSSPEIEAAYEDIRNDKTKTAWMLLNYETDKSDKLVVSATGEGDLKELAGHLQENQASFGYARVSFSNDAESVRSKFILITYIGPSVKILRKAKLSVHSSDVKRVLRAYSIEVPASGADDLDEKPIIERLRKAGGASYDGV